MVNIAETLELNGQRQDFAELLGVTNLAPNGEPETTVTIVRQESTQTAVFNETTGLYDTVTNQIVIATTIPAHISPVIFRRDRAESAGGDAIRVRQYRAIVQWDAGDIHIGDFLTVNTCSDTEFVGKTLDITDVLYESDLAVRRLSLVDTTRDFDPNC